MRHIPMNQKLWEKTVDLSRKYTGIRAIAVAWIAVYLFLYHLGRRWMERLQFGGMRRWIALVVVMSLMMVNPAFLGVGSVMAAGEEVEGAPSGAPDESGFPDEPEEAENSDEPEGTGSLDEPEGTGSMDEPEGTESMDELEGTGSPDEPESTGRPDEPETISFRLSAGITARPESVILEGYTEQPRYEITLTNTGTTDAPLDGIMLTEGKFELYCQAIPDDELADDETADQTEDVQKIEEAEEQLLSTLPAQLTPGQTMILYVVLPLSQPIGVIQDVLCIPTGVSEEVLELPLEFEVCSAQGDGVENEGTPTEETPRGDGLTENGDQEVSGDEQNLGEETPDGETTEDTPVEENGEESEETLEEALLEESDTTLTEGFPVESDSVDEELAEEAAEEENETEIVEEEVTVSLPSMQECYRPSGIYMGDIYFANEQSVYQFQVENEIGANIICRYNNVEEALTYMDGFYTWTVPQDFDAPIEIGYVSESGEFVSLLSEHVVTDQMAPQVSYQCSPDNSKMLLINLEETQIVNSGIKDYQISVDGEQVVPETEQTLETQVIGGADEIISKLELGVCMELGWHEVEVYATDNIGNVASVQFRVEIEPQDVISVVLPTSFDIALRPWDLTDQICSDDIVICNRSKFAIDVQISSVEVDVDKSIPEGEVVKATLPTDDGAYEVQEYATETKSCDMDLRLLTADNEQQVFEAPEGMTNNVTTFLLGESREDTDPQQLREIEHAEGVKSDDYAIVNFRGMLVAGSENWWKDGDLKVRVVFSFEKHQQEDVQEDSNDWSVCSNADVAMN